MENEKNLYTARKTIPVKLEGLSVTSCDIYITKQYPS